MADEEPSAAETPPQPSDAARSTNLEANFTVFAFLWAMGAFFHKAESGFWVRSPVEVGETLAVLFVLLRPKSGAAFLTLVGFQLVQNWLLLPLISNHTFFLWFMTLTIVLAAVSLAVRGGYSRAALFRSVAPALRVELLILYFYVVFHKLTTEFFDPATSCASAITDRLVAMLQLPIHLDALHPIAIWVTLLAEAAIPILLALRGTRMWGIALGLMFHFVVGLANFYDFSAILFACYFLFAPEGHALTLAAWWRGVCERPPLRGVAAFLAGPWWWRPLLGVALLLVLLAFDPKVRLFWWIYGLSVIAIHLASFRLAEPDRRSTRELLRIRNGLLWLGPALVLLNGWSPYLGLKSEHSFAMFSNLRTEGGESNHLIVPAGTQLLPYLDELVTVESTSDAALATQLALSDRMTWAALRTHVSTAAAAGHTGIALTYLRDGRRIELTNAELDPELSQLYPWPLRKLLLFRALVDPENRSTCLH